MSTETIGHDRVPPYDEAAEKGILGSLLLDGDRVLPLVMQRGITSETFYLPAHKEIFAGMADIFRSGRSLDPLILGSHLRTIGTLEKCGGELYIDRLMDSTPTPTHAEYYTDIVEARWMRRRIIAAAREAEATAHDPETEDADELIAKAQSGFLKIQSGRKSGDKQAAWDNVVRNVEGAMNGEVVGLPSPFPSFDQATGGPRKGMVTVLASKKGYGKSSLCATWMHHLATRPNPIPVLGMPFEDGEELTWLRIAGIESRISSFMATLGRLEQAQCSTILNAGQRMIDTPLHLVGRRGMTVDAITATAIQYKMRYDIGALFIDGFKDIRREWRDTNSEDARISAGLCDLAEILQIPVVVVHHVVKAGGKDEKGEARKINVEEIRGNFRIIDDARMVMILQSATKDEDGNMVDPYKLECARNNHGPTGTVDLEFETSCNRFFERPVSPCGNVDEIVPDWVEEEDIPRGL